MPRAVHNGATLAEADGTVVYGGRHCFPVEAVRAEIRPVAVEDDGSEILDVQVPGAEPVRAWRLPLTLPAPLSGWIAFDRHVAVEV